MFPRKIPRNVPAVCVVSAENSAELSGSSAVSAENSAELSGGSVVSTENSMELSGGSAVSAEKSADFSGGSAVSAEKSAASSSGSEGDVLECCLLIKFIQKGYFKSILFEGVCGWGG